MKRIFSLVAMLGFLLILFSISQSLAHASATHPGNHLLETPGVIAGDPTEWFNEDWHYRRAVVISNSGSYLPWYQVLVRLDINNFDFSHARDDGSDIRVTYSNGTTELPFWIESWDKAHYLAYIWVQVLGVPAGDMRVYIYYGNPAADSASNGNATFDRFEDNWNGFDAAGARQRPGQQFNPSTNAVFSPFSWNVIGGDPYASGGEMVLPNGAGIRSQSTTEYGAMGMRATFGTGEGNEFGGFINGDSGPRTVIGDLATDLDDLYLMNFAGDDSRILEGASDWHNTPHIYELRWSSGESIGDIDHGIVTASNLLQVPAEQLPITLFNHNSGADSALTIDWVYLRQYIQPEPGSAVGAEQGLVELGISSSDYPDPLRKGEKLTYQLTISNTANIDAPGVVVTDTLPDNVVLAELQSSPGTTCEPGRIILCDLNTISPDSEAWVTISVTPTTDGIITNSAQVGSPGYELDWQNNTSLEKTLVDSVSPVVTWTLPIENGQIYYTFGGNTTLQVTATDNDAIDRVEFWWFEPPVDLYHHIATRIMPPYQTQFDTDILPQGKPFWIEARAYDRAGNSNFPDNRSNIYIFRQGSSIYLPLVTR